MRIQNNIMAMNAYRNYTTNTNAISGNLEKLSSGYKVNRAGDDAAGLAISEKMRAQITGLDVAQKNANDGISLVQTAEGALAEVHSMLNRMYELANQSANGTYDDAVDRNNLNKEITALKEEINRIADSANFNGINLLDGTQAAPEITTTEDVAAVVAAENVFTSGAVSLGGAVEDGDATVTVGYTAADGTTSSVNVTVTLAAGDDAAAVATKINTALNGNATLANVTFAGDETGITATSDNPGPAGTAALVTNITVTGPGTGTTALAIAGGSTTTAGVSAAAATNASATIDFGTRDITAGATVTIGNTTYEFVTNAADVTQGNTAVTINEGDTQAQAVTALQAVITETGFTAAVTATNNGITLTADAAGATLPDISTTGIGGLTLQVGDTSAAFNQLTVSVGDMHTNKLGDVENADLLADIDISTQEGAAAATDVIKAAINQVSSTRGDLGAIQNRLDHTINNLSVMEENIQNAESAIRDTDVAEEMMAYTKNNILIQSAQAMLAQANQIPQGVLQLLG